MSDSPPPPTRFSGTGRVRWQTPTQNTYPDHRTASRRFEHFESIQECPACGAATLKPAFEPDVVRCGACRVYLRSPRPTQEEIQRFYDAGSTFDGWVAEKEMRERLWRKRVRLLLRYAPPGRLLDIGTGDGHFLGVAAAAGFQVHATEMSQRGIELCVQRGFEVFHGRPEDAEWGARQFDVVTLWHVLEHVPDPARLLGLAARLLSPGGLLAVAVPNEDAQLVPHRLRWRDKGHPLGVLAWGEEVHLTHFQPSTLRRALRGAGLRIVSTGVDDVYVRRSIGDLASLYLNKTVCMLTGGGWHGARAMFCLATKPVPGAAAR